MPGGDRDQGLTAAIAGAGGVSRLARELGVRRQSIQWTRVPQHRLFDVSRISGVPPATLRPDLADWIGGETARRRMALARSRFSLVRAAVDHGRHPDTPRCEDELAIDVLTALAAVRFVAAERSLSQAQVMVGETRPQGAARALAMALAHVCGRAKSPAIAGLFGTSRQNVDNASERYLRARDGDDPDDFLAAGDGGPRVIERGRVRRAKAAVDALWDLEARFLALIQPPEPAERRRA